MSNIDQRQPITAMAVFAGFAGLVRIVGCTVTRARRANRFGRADWRIPVLCLVDAGAAGSALEILAGQFAGPGKRRVPHAYVNVAGLEGLRPLLHHLHDTLAAGRFSRDPLRFRCFTLIEWLMMQDLSEVAVAKRHRELARRLRREIGLSRGQGDTRLDQAFTGWVGLVVSLVVTMVPVVALRGLISGRLPGVGREFRWFRGQQYLASGPASTFLAVAERLTVGPRADEEPEAIDRLLMDAFLEDLRVQYRRRPWRLRPWRRTAYPVVLLDTVASGNAGYALLRAITAVRGDGWTDPLVVVTRGIDVPPDGTPLAEAAADGRVAPLAGLDAAYAAVHDRLPMGGKRGHPDTWLLPVAVSGTDDLRTQTSNLPTIIPPRPPWLAQRWLPAVVVLTLLAGGTTWIKFQLHPGCETLRFGGTPRVVYTDRQCIGYSDSDQQTFGPDRQLVNAQKKIFAYNREADSARKVKSNRPLVTLVYLAAFTKPDARPGDEVFVGERDGLEGVAVAQYRALREAENNPASPYLRVIVANVGDETRHIGDLEPMLADLVRDDPTVIAAVAQVDSRTKTQEMLESLDTIGLPTVTLTTSADGISGMSNLYLQLSPPTAEEARVIHAYTSEVLHRTDLMNIYTYGSKGHAGGKEDLYVNTLRDDLHTEFKDRYHEEFWPNGVSVTNVCSDVFDGVVFFGGRYSEFAAFAAQLYTDCDGKLPVLLADGSVNRYMGSLRTREIAPTTLPLAYIGARGELSYCRSLATAPQAERKNFLSDIRVVLNRCAGDTPDGELIGDWSGLGYDAVRILLRSVKDIASRRPSMGSGRSWDPKQINPRMVYNQIRQFIDPQHPYPGVSGLLMFDQNGIAHDRHIAIMCAPNLQQAFRTEKDLPYEVYRSGLAYPDEPLLRPRLCSA
jgi:hypothetical protein